MDTFSGGSREDSERVDGVKVAAMKMAMTRLSFWIRISLMAGLAVVMVLLGVGLSNWELEYGRTPKGAEVDPP